MMRKFLLIVMVFCVLSLTTGAPKEDKETKEDEDPKDEEDTKHDMDDDKKDNENKVDESLDKEKDGKDDKGDDEKDEESKDDEEKKDENKDGESKDDESKDDESKEDESKDGKSKNEEETKDDKNKDESSKDHSKMDIITRFSLELFRKVAEEKRHHSFSLSALPIWKQMSCLLAGTEGDTKKQLSKMLYHGEGEEDLKTELFSPKLNDVLKVYSRIYITEDAKLKAEFSPKKRHRRSIDDEEQGDESSEVSNEKIEEEEEEEELNSNEKIEEEANEKIEEEDLNSNEKIEEDKLNSMEDAVKADSKEDKSKENKKDDKPEEDEKHKDGGGVDDLNSKCDYSKLFKKVDFSNLKAVNKTINRDFYKASHGKFKRVLGKGVIDKKTKMLMINAVEFKGKLLESFDEKLTVKKNFYSYKNEKVGTVNMMIKKSTFPYYHCTKLGASILELPYVNKMSLFVYLPDVTNIDAKNLLNKFKDPTKVMKNLDKMNDTKVDVYLPKFKATANIHAHLKKALKHMGLADIFKTEDAKLQGFLEDDLEDFSLKTVSQAIRFTVNEKGSLEGAKVSGSSIKFVCNRPFAFMVIDKETSHPIITGEFNSPKDIHL